MKSNTGRGYIKTLILTIIIIICAVSGLYFIKMQYHKAKIKTIKTNMSLIEFKASEYINKQKAEGKEEINYAGTKLSDLKDDTIVKQLKDRKVINEEELEKYYLLSDENLAELNTKFENEKDSFYIVNYETGEVIFSAGCQLEDDKILYKLNDIEKLDNEN